MKQTTLIQPVLNVWIFIINLPHILKNCFLDVWTTFPPSHKTSIQMTVAKSQISPINKLVASAFQPSSKRLCDCIKNMAHNIKRKKYKKTLQRLLTNTTTAIHAMSSTENSMVNSLMTNSKYTSSLSYFSSHQCDILWLCIL
jgi:hypothetical protein